jgi:probable rRNA maturation factor
VPDITIQLHVQRWKTLLKPYCKTVREACDAALGKKLGKAEVTVVLADDRFVHDLNKTYRGKDKATNILSFAGEGNHLGDLVLALETIEREAEEQDKSFKDHVRHLLVHGTLHLLGYDHERKNEAERMEAMEVKILKNLGVTNPYL